MKQTEYNTFLYLGEFPYTVIANPSVMKTISKNVEEKVNLQTISKNKIQIESLAPIKIVKDDNFKYLEILGRGNKFDYIRYGQKIRTILKENETYYKIKTNLPIDDWAFSNIFKKIYFSDKASQKPLLIHGSTIEMDGNGIMFTGPRRSGKTTLTTSFLDNFSNSVFVSEENTLLKNNSGKVYGNYLPGSVYARFSTYEKFKRLSKFLNQPILLDATQVLDEETIKKIIEKKRYDLDLGLNISRESFVNSFEIESKPTTEIKKIIFTEYLPGAEMQISKLPPEIAIKYLQLQEISINNSLEKTRKKDEMYNTGVSLIDESWLQNIEFLKVSFGEKTKLNKGGLERLI